MKTLEEHNNKILHTYKDEETYPKLNNIPCPNCGEELYDKDNLILCSYPPKRNVICLNTECNYTGYRY